MKQDAAIGKDWANSILSKGYQSDKKNPNVTYVKIWNKKTQQFETKELSSDNRKMRKLTWRGNM